jgi:hypothetical protein
LSDDGLTVNVPVPVEVEADATTSVTGMVAGLPETPGAVTVTAPLYVAAARPVVLTEMLTVAGVVPLGVAESQAAPPVEVVNAVPDGPDTFTAWAAGAAPPMV